MIVKNARISSKGQVTIPLEVRQWLGVGEGDELRFVAQSETVLVEAIRRPDADALYGIFNEPDDQEDFVFDSEVARAERAKRILGLDAE